MNLIINSQKIFSKGKKIEKAKALPIYYIPLNEFGNAMTPIVKVGDKVLKNQTLALGSPPFQNKVHSPVSGLIIDFLFVESFSYIVVKNDFNETSLVSETFDPLTLSPDELINKIKDGGIVGNGGAMFPSYSKLRVAFDSNATILIINGAECEPFLTSDYSLMKFFPQEIMKAIIILKRILNFSRVIIAIEKQNKDLKKRFLEVAQSLSIQDFSVYLLPDKYPQGGELQVIKSVTGTEIRKGVIPAFHNIIVHNVGTIWQIYRLLFQKEKFTERVVTIVTDDQNVSSNYLVKIGTNANDLLSSLGYKRQLKDSLLIGGGPMMGNQLNSNFPILGKGMAGLLLLKSYDRKYNNCIECGYCVDVCPQKLMPLEFERACNNNSLTHAVQFNINDCILCGACDYICPSDIPLMRSIRKLKETSI